MIAHIDADSFFASVIVRSHPELRGKPVLAIGMGGGCVIAATYEAKAKGVKTGMPLFEAKKLVPDAVQMAADFRETGIASEQIESILKDCCPCVEQMSIDEWYLDLRTLVGGVPKNPEAWGREIQKRILTMTDLSVSIGIAGSKLLSKMAGEYKKPAGVTVVEKRNTEIFLKDRPAAAIPGIGRQRQNKTDAHGWVTAWHIATASEADIIRVCGRPGKDMQRELLGEPISAVTNEIKPPKSISRCRTFKGTDDRTIPRAHLLKHLEYCTMKMRRWNLGCTEVSVWIRTPDFAYYGAHRKLSRTCVTASEIAGSALSAFSGLTWQGKRVNQVGLALGGLRASNILQPSLFDDQKQTHANEHLQMAMDTLHTRFGRDSVTRAAALPVSSGTVKDLDLQIVE